MELYDLGLLADVLTDDSLGVWWMSSREVSARDDEV
jgi:hypothetical protein